MNAIAEELNRRIRDANPYIYNMLSCKGKELCFPKGILAQGAEAKGKAFEYNATIGIAAEHGVPMHLSSVMSHINIEPQYSLDYAPSFGVPELRKRWRTDLLEKNPSLNGKAISLPVVVNGITHGLSVTADMWVDANDTILIPDKMWGNYTLIFSVLHGARIRRYPFFSREGGFGLNAFGEAIQKQASDTRKIIVLLNFPNNPTGYTPTITEGKRIREILVSVAEQGNDVLVITDDAYFGLFYDEITLKESLFALLSGTHQRIMVVKLDGATKEAYVWGSRVGFVTYGGLIKEDSLDAYDALESKTGGAIRGSISNNSHLGQSIILRALDSDNYASEKGEKFEIMLRRANRVKEALDSTKYAEAWDVYPFNSGYFMCLGLKTVDPEALRLHLLEQYGVGIITLGKTDIRVAFSCVDEENILELFEIIFQAVKDLENRSSP